MTGTPHEMDDLAERLTDKALILDGMAEEARSHPEWMRLRGKAEGVRLALSFVDEYRRAFKGAAS
jgi:hypothetical protein